MILSRWASAAREREYLHASIEELDREPAFRDRLDAGLTDANALVGRVRIDWNTPFTCFQHSSVMPLFAFSNAGVGLHGSLGAGVPLAVILGLAIGKPLGITGAALAAVRLRLASLPDGVNWTRCTDARGWPASVSRCRSSLLPSLLRARRCSTQPSSGFWPGRSWRVLSARLLYGVARRCGGSPEKIEESRVSP